MWRAAHPVPYGSPAADTWTVERARHAVEFTERPERFLYGTDRPLAPMDVYPRFVERLFAEKDHAGFGENAKKLFEL